MDGRRARVRAGWETYLRPSVLVATDVDQWGVAEA